MKSIRNDCDIYAHVAGHQTNAFHVFSPGYAQRYCDSDGNWSPRKDSKGATNKKTDYQPCGEVVELRNRATVHIIAYAISVVALIPALFIFFAYK